MPLAHCLEAQEISLFLSKRKRRIGWPSINLPPHLLYELSLVCLVSSEVAFRALTARAEEQNIFWKREADSLSVRSGREGEEEDRAAHRLGWRWLATDNSTGGGLDIPNAAIIWTSSLEKALTGTLCEKGLSQKRRISVTHSGAAGISCLTGEVRDGRLFPSYKSLSAPWPSCWDGQLINENLPCWLVRTTKYSRKNIFTLTESIFPTKSSRVRWRT